MKTKWEIYETIDTDIDSDVYSKSVVHYVSSCQRWGANHVKFGSGKEFWEIFDDAYLEREDRTHYGTGATFAEAVKNFRKNLQHLIRIYQQRLRYKIPEFEIKKTGKRKKGENQ